MVEHLEIVNAAVSLLVKAALLAARFSGRVYVSTTNETTPVTVLSSRIAGTYILEAPP